MPVTGRNVPPLASLSFQNVRRRSAVKEIGDWFERLLDRARPFLTRTMRARAAYTPAVWGPHS